MVKEKPDLSDRQVTSQSEQVLTYVLVTSLGWEAALSPLNSSLLLSKMPCSASSVV